MMAEALHETNEGVNVGGELLKDVRLADDRGMVAYTGNRLQIIMDGVNEVTQKYGMNISVKKTKLMIISRQGGKMLEQVVKFCYLRSWITDDWIYVAEIRARIAMAKAALSRRKDLLSRNMSQSVKKKIVKAVCGVCSCMDQKYGL
ncbi:uncharacterized protein LOC134765755 [Penaeus indicus]|uniref:uncharacterized protein LOC134765755 n=1 Tax=Penaeus indicus TaxID=29960 RepID=UPI00300D39AF